MFSLIPPQYRILATLGALALTATALFLYGVHVGYSWSEGAHERANARIERANIEHTMALVKEGAIESKQYQSAIKSLADYAAKQRGRIHERITPFAVDTCRLTRGTIGVLNESARPDLPGGAAAPGGLDDAPAGVAIDTVAGIVADNYVEVCAANAEQLRRLQAYVRKLGEHSREAHATRGQ